MPPRDQAGHDGRYGVRAAKGCRAVRPKESAILESTRIRYNDPADIRSRLRQGMFSQDSTDQSPSDSLAAQTKTTTVSVAEPQNPV